MYSIALHCAMLCCIVLCCAASHRIAMHCMVLCCIVLCCTALYCIALCCAALHCIMQHRPALRHVALCCAALRCTMQHCTAPRCTAALHGAVLHCMVLCTAPCCTVRPVALRRVALRRVPCTAKAQRSDKAGTCPACVMPAQLQLTSCKRQTSLPRSNNKLATSFLRVQHEGARTCPCPTDPPSAPPAQPQHKGTREAPGLWCAMGTCTLLQHQPCPGQAPGAAAAAAVCQQLELAANQELKLSGN